MGEEGWVFVAPFRVLRQTTTKMGSVRCKAVVALLLIAFLLMHLSANCSAQTDPRASNYDYYAIEEDYENPCVGVPQEPEIPSIKEIISNAKGRRLLGLPEEWS